ncbi:MAG: hypothetical protein IJO48_06375, partial [Clostridia bacterium]|nr:hypothetical protein [Clostridia bacterium]
MKRLISVMLVVMMVFSLLPMSSLGETVEKITADAPNTGIEAANSNVEAVTNADGSTTYTNVYQRVSQIDDVNARYLIVYDGGAVDKAFTAHTTGNLQTAAGNATDISVTQLEGADGNGNENYYSITTTGGNALEAKHKWYFSSTTTDTNKKKAHAMYVRSELNDYYLQANSTRDSGTLFKINTKKYSDLSGNGYMFDELWLNEYPVPPKQNDTPLWGPTQATAATPVNGTTKFTIAELIAASTVVYDYYTANGELPGTIYINSGNTTYAVSDEDYNYMASKALANGTAGGTLTTTTSITYKNCGNPNVTSTSTYTGSTVTMAQLASIAAKSYAYVDNGNNYPASNGSVLSGTVNYDEIYLMNARALDYYADNSKLPSTITYVDMGTFTTGKIGDTPIAGTITGSATSTPTPAPTTPTTFTIAQIIQAARHELSVRGTYYLTAVSGSHSIGGYSVSRVDFFMLMCRAVVALNSGSATSATVPYKSYTEPSYSTEEYASGGTSLFTKANYVAYANAQINAHPNGGTPTSAFGSSTFSGLGSTANITYGAMICTLIRVLDLYGRNGSLPA